MPQMEFATFDRHQVVKVPGDLDGVATEGKCEHPCCEDGPIKLPKMVKIFDDMEGFRILLITNDNPKLHIGKKYPNFSTNKVAVIVPATPEYEQRVMKTLREATLDPAGALRAMRDAWSGEEDAPRVMIRDDWMKGGLLKQPRVWGLSVMKMAADFRGFPTVDGLCTEPMCDLPYEACVANQLKQAEKPDCGILLMFVCANEHPRLQPVKPKDWSTDKIAVIGPLTPSNEKKFMKLLKEKKNPREILEEVAATWKGVHAPIVQMKDGWMRG